MTKYFCDACGKETKSTDMWLLDIYLGSKGKRIISNCCNVCRQKVYDFTKSLSLPPSRQSNSSRD